MKILKFFCACVLSALVVLSCTDKGTESSGKTTLLKVTPTRLDFGAAITTLPIVIKNNTADEVSYTILEYSDWLSCDPTDGEVNSESDVISVTVDRPAAPGDYDAYLWVLTDEDTIVVDVDMTVGTVSGTGYFGTLIITLDQTWPGDNIFSNYHDIIAINFTLDVIGSSVVGTGSATRSCTVSDGDCTVTGVTAPSFNVAISGVAGGGVLVFNAIPTSPMSTDVVISLMCDDDPATVPGQGLLESYVLTENVDVSVPMIDGGGGGGSGTSDIGEDPEFDYSYSVTIYED